MNAVWKEPGYQPEYASYKTLLLELAQQRSLDGAIDFLAQRLAQRPHVALVRVWLLGPGDRCGTCALRSRCTHRDTCLHLAASAGRSVDGRDNGWREPEPVQRLPLDAAPAGRIALDGEDLVLRRDGSATDPDLGVRRDWLEREEVAIYGGMPLVCQGEVLGVLEMFLRCTTVGEGPLWQRLVADHLAAVVVNARAFGELERALAEVERLRRQLEQENELLRQELSERGRYGDIVGASPAIASIVDKIDKVAPTDATVLITGESGVGKELVAREIHRRSRRRDGPLIRVNCGAIPAELFESEFFGHVRGAFSGASRDRVGRFEAADGGTLFLDEVGELPLSLQIKLLRTLQDGQIERVGETRPRQVDVRIVAATNRDLAVDVEAGRFRLDLFYRLNVFPIEVPPLRQRAEDIPLITQHLLDRLGPRFGKPGAGLTPADVAELMAYDWPGNVRELQNVVERALITARDGQPRFRLSSVARVNGDRTRTGPLSATRAGMAPSVATPAILTEDELRRLERDNVRAALERSNGRVFGAGGAAELLGLKPTTLLSRMKQMKLKRPDAAASDR